MKQIKKRLLALLACAALCAGLLSGTAGALPVQAGSYQPTYAAESTTGYYMVIDADGGLWAWGNNRCGGLGVPSVADGEELRTPAKLMDGAASVFTGFLSTYVVKQDGSLWSWGRNIDGEQGFGEYDGSSRRYQPEEVYEPRLMLSGGVRSVSSENGTTLVLMEDGRLLGCGSNARLRIDPDGRESDRGYQFHEIMTGVRDVSVGYSTVCVIKNDGSLWAYGGLTLFGLPQNEHGPVKITDNAASVSAKWHDCVSVLKTDGTLWVYSRSLTASNGERLRPEAGSPVQVAQGVIAADSDRTNISYVTEDGVLWTFGTDGDSYAKPSSDKTLYCYDSPLRVDENVDNLVMSSGDYFMLYQKTDGTLWKCGWGIQYNGFSLREPVQIFENALIPASLARVQVPSSWAVEAALWAGGYPDLIEKFDGRWQQNISRAEFAAVVVTMTEQILGRALPAAPAGTFRDTSDPYVLKASLAGIVKGTGEGVFSPDLKLTREELAVMVHRAILYIQQETGRNLLPQTGDLSAFTDRDQVSSWAVDAMSALVANRFLNGTGGGAVSPKGPATIEQALLIALRVTRQ